MTGSKYSNSQHAGILSFKDNIVEQHATSDIRSRISVANEATRLKQMRLKKDGGNYLWYDLFKSPVSLRLTLGVP